ncbi:MAG TPA: beta-ketoacyl-ACP synthase III [Miltoncostaeaceae bacterium]|nr:beta-ketoacyl-ACP synthase III [Miltoncostaeaceae bacterium]
MLAIRNGKGQRARLAALGAYAPERVMTNAELERMVETSDDWIVSRTGIRERRIAAPDQAASDLAALAAEATLERAGVPAEQVDVLIVMTASPDYIFPATATVTADRIGARNAAAYDLMAGCTGFLYGLAQACALVESGLAGTVLLVGTEALSRHVNWTDRGTCVLFGDGAGAALVVADDEEAVTGFMGFDLGADGSGACDLLIPAGGSRRPVGPGVDPGEAKISMNGREVFKFATRTFIDSVTRLLERLEMGIDEIDLVVPHQANQRIIEYGIERLGIDPGRVFGNLERYGNTSAASIPLALVEARDSDRLHAGDLLLLTAFGAGLTWGTTVVRYEPAETA